MFNAAPFQTRPPPWHNLSHLIRQSTRSELDGRGDKGFNYSISHLTNLEEYNTFIVPPHQYKKGVLAPSEGGGNLENSQVLFLFSHFFLP